VQQQSNSTATPANIHIASVVDTEPMTIKELVDKSYGTAKAKGWHDSPREVGTLLMLMVGELSEAMEEARDNKPDIYFNRKPRSYGEMSSGIIEYKDAFTSDGSVHPDLNQWFEANKPEGQLIEIADTVIRIFDYCGLKGWDLEKAIRLKMAHNETRPQRHGGKSF
jgi:NTP pyrophosphatase (non-canonical NTP hydrolase)